MSETTILPEPVEESEILKPYVVSITETLQKEVSVMAHDLSEAEQRVMDEYYSEDQILDSDYFVGVDFSTKLDERANEIRREEEPQMNENGTSLADNEYVKELFGILSENGGDVSGLSLLLGHVSDMENAIKLAEDRISEMKAQLTTMTEIQNHPVKTALQNTIKLLEIKVEALKERLGKLKSNIIDGCKNAVTAFKEKGAAALNGLASFFRVKEGLKDWKKDIQAIVQADKKAIAQIQTFSHEYHTAGRHLKNMARVAVGKTPKDTKKEAGKLAKVVAAPYRAQISTLKKLSLSIDNAIGRLDNFDKSVSERQTERATAKRPSLMERLEEGKAQVERVKLETPPPERAVPAQSVEI